MCASRLVLLGKETNAEKSRRLIPNLRYFLLCYFQLCYFPPEPPPPQKTAFSSTISSPAPPNRLIALHNPSTEVETVASKAATPLNISHMSFFSFYGASGHSAIDM